MRQLRPSLLTLALGAAAAVALASCGGDADLLPGDTAREITANLDAVEDLANSGDCAGAQSAAQQVRDQIEALGGVDGQLKQALRDGADRLNEVVESCVETTTEAISPAVIPNEDTTESPGKEKKQKKQKKDEGDDDGDEESDDQDEEPPAPPRTRPTTPAPPEEPPPAGGGTGAPGGVAPGAPAGEDGD